MRRRLLILVALLLCTALLGILRFPWEVVHTNWSGDMHILSLPRRPAWSAPEPVSYATLRTVFPDLPEEQDAADTIRIIARHDLAIFEFALSSILLSIMLLAPYSAMRARLPADQPNYPLRRWVFLSVISFSVLLAEYFTWQGGEAHVANYLIVGVVVGLCSAGLGVGLAIGIDKLLRSDPRYWFVSHSSDSAVDRLGKHHRRRGLMRLALAVLLFFAFSWTINPLNGNVSFLTLPLLFAGLYCLSTGVGLLFFGRGDLASNYYCRQCGYQFLDPPMQGLIVTCPKCSANVQT